MSEETNLNMVDETTAGAGENPNLPESLFDETEIPAETKPEAEVEVEKAEGEEKTEEKVETAPQTLKLKYNGEEKEISIEEAVALAQKGMNYDHIMSERDSYKANTELLKKCAKESGLTLEQYTAALESNSLRTAMADEYSKLEEEFPDMPEEAMEELARFRIEQRNRERLAQEEAENRKIMEATAKPWKDFLKFFPGVSIADLPASVKKSIDEDGRTPIEAYQSHLIAELNKKIETAEQTGMNKIRSIGSATGDAAEKTKDAFLEGFL